MPGSRWAAALERARDQVTGACQDLDPAARRWSTAGVRWPIDLAGTDRTASDQHHRLGAGRTHPHLGHERPGRRPEPINHHQPGRAGRAASRRGGRSSRWLIGWWWWSARPAPARPPCCLVPSKTSTSRDVRCSGSPRPPKRPGCSDRRRGSARTRWPSCCTSGPAPTGPPTPATGCPAGATVIVDEAGIIGTASLHQLVGLAEDHDWRLVLVGDPQQLQAVGRGGMFNELCAHQPSVRAGSHPPVPPTMGSGRLPATPSREPEGARRLRSPRADHRRTLRRITSPASPSNGCNTPPPGRRWPSPPPPTTTSTPSTTPSNTHDSDTGQLSDTSVAIGGGERAHVGDVVATRRNDRSIHTTTGEPVRNRDLWTVTAIHDDGDLTVVPQRWARHRPAARPATPLSMCGSVTPPPSTATKPTPSTSASTSSRRPPPTAGCTSA